MYIQCRFNGEILSTDPVELVTSPIWDTELAWDIDAKILGFLRSQRASLKLVCFTLDHLNRREAVGYVMLDLRAASQEGPVPEKWSKLINTKLNATFKPEIKLAFSVSIKEDAKSLSTIPKLSNARPESPSKNLYTDDWPSPEKAMSKSPIKSKKKENVKPNTISSTPLSIKLHEQGYYQVGNAYNAPFWSIWITIAFAEYLNQLSPLLESGVQTQGDFYFYYTFLGNEIVTQRFSDLNQPNFPAERVSIRLQCTEQDLQTFLKESGNLIIYLCQSGKALGFTNVSLAQILEQTPQSDSDLRVMESVYALFNTKQALVVSDEGTSPSIGLSIALSLEERISSPQKEPTPSLNVKKSINLETQGHSQVHANPLVSFESFNQGNSLKENVKPADWHQYRFSVDLKSIRDFQHVRGNVFFKYAYPPFGTSSPTISHPPCSVSKSISETVLPNTFCAFEFVMSPDRLRTYLDAVPLILELWNKDEFEKDIPFGLSTLHLAEIFKTASQILPGNPPIEVYSLDSFYPITASGHDGGILAKVADVRVILALEDFGPVEEGGDPEEMIPGLKTWLESSNVVPPPPSSSFTVLKESKKSQKPIVSQKLRKSEIPEIPEMSKKENSTLELSIHDTPEYKIALELELYKQEEEKKFRIHLQQRESELLQQLLSEWKKKEKERDALSKKKMEELSLLESQFQKLITDLEARERKLDVGEEDLSKRKKDIEREFEKRIEEARDATRRLQEEFKHRLELEKGKTMEMESQKSKTYQERDEWESRYKSLESEFVEFKKNLGSSNEAQLRAELNTILQSKSELEKQVLILTQSKKHYKSEWIKAVSNYAKSKKEWLAQEEAQQAREKRELSRLKIHYFAKEELGNVDSERLDLLNLKKELEELKSHHHQPKGIPSLSLKENLNPELMVEIERLTREKDQLLKSGGAFYFFYLFIYSF